MYNNENKFNTEVPIQDKVLLTFPQAAKYSGIGENKLRELAEFSECILKNGNRKLIKRVLFEEYLTEQDEI